jgi:hypothetical protein
MILPNRQAAPDHGEVVGVALAADDGDAQGDRFVVGHLRPYCLAG